MYLPSYNQVEALLENVALEKRASEWHGFLCGAIAVDIAYPLVTSIQTMISNTAEVAMGNDLSGQFDEVYSTVLAQLTDSNLQFQLCLPEGEDVGLGEQVNALAEWCAGFLYGLANAGIQTKGTLSADVQEILQDVGAIAQVDGVELANEEEEVSFIELVEFVRVAVLLLAEEVQPMKSSRTVH